MPLLRLKHIHTHGGVANPPGHVIEVSEATARWLTQHDVAIPADGQIHLPPRREQSGLGTTPFKE